jgi:hypothetical protein
MSTTIELDELVNRYWRARMAHDDALATSLYAEYTAGWDAAWAEAQAATEFAGVTIPEDVKKATCIRPGSLRVHEFGILWRSTAGFDPDWYPTDKLLSQLGFRLTEQWCDGFRAVWTRTHADRSGEIVTFCEGDIDVTVHPTAEAMQAQIASAAAFYGART